MYKILAQPPTALHHCRHKTFGLSLLPAFPRQGATFSFHRERKPSQACNTLDRMKHRAATSKLLVCQHPNANVSHRVPDFGQAFGFDSVRQLITVVVPRIPLGQDQRCGHKRIVNLIVGLRVDCRFSVSIVNLRWNVSVSVNRIRG